MSLPLPNLGNPLASLVTPLATPLATLGGALAISQRTTQVFGDLLSRPNPTPASGPSESKSPTKGKILLPSAEHPDPQASESRLFYDKLHTIRQRLQRWLSGTAEKIGSSFQTDTMKIKLGPDQSIDVEGDARLRMELLHHLRSDPELAEELRSLQRQQPNPLRWLPQKSNARTDSPSLDTPSSGSFDPFVMTL